MKWSDPSAQPHPRRGSPQFHRREASHRRRGVSPALVPRHRPPLKMLQEGRAAAGRAGARPPPTETMGEIILIITSSETEHPRFRREEIQLSSVLMPNPMPPWGPDHRGLRCWYKALPVEKYARLVKKAGNFSFEGFLLHGNLIQEFCPHVCKNPTGYFIPAL